MALLVTAAWAMAEIPTAHAQQTPPAAPVAVPAPVVAPAPIAAATGETPVAAPGVVPTAAPTATAPTAATAPADGSSNAANASKPANADNTDSDAIPHNGWKGSFMFSGEEITALRKLINSLSGGETQVAGPISDAPDFLTALTQDATKPQKQAMPVFRVSSIVFYNTKDWMIFLSGKRITSFQKDPIPQVTIHAVTPRSVDIEWKPLQNLQLRQAYFDKKQRDPKAIETLPITFDEDSGSIRFTLRPNQSFVPETMNIVEGRVLAATMPAAGNGGSSMALTGSAATGPGVSPAPGVAAASGAVAASQAEAGLTTPQNQNTATNNAATNTGQATPSTTANTAPNTAAPATAPGVAPVVGPNGAAPTALPAGAANIAGQAAQPVQAPKPPPGTVLNTDGTLSLLNLPPMPSPPEQPIQSLGQGGALSLPPATPTAPTQAPAAASAPTGSTANTTQ